MLPFALSHAQDILSRSKGKPEVGRCRPRTGAALLLIVLSGASCSEGPQCYPAFGYAEVLEYDADSLTGASCVAELASTAVVAHYTFEAVPKSYNSPCSTHGPSPQCVPAGASPVPTYCAAGPCAIWLEFSQQEAFALRDYLGSENFAMTVTCDGKVIAQREVKPSKEMCAY